MKRLWILISIMLSFPAMSDTLYQADMTGAGLGVGYGVDVSPGFSYAPGNYYGGYTPGIATSGVPYDNFTYPYSSGCCGCNTCNGCGTGYSIRCR
jgi:hypothetical protein